MSSGAEDLVLYGMVMGSAGLAARAAYPAAEQLWLRWMNLHKAYQQHKAEQARKVLDDIFVDVTQSRLKLLYGLTPVAAAAAGWLLFQTVWMAVAGLVIGIVLPDVIVRQIKARRIAKFLNQLVDALFITSSSLKAGLSLIQALEVVQEEMPSPISQEFGLIIKAHRLGRTFEESLQKLNDRIPTEEVNLMTTALLVGRETGGDVTEIISQLITTIREKKKLNEKVKTLTLQGKMQAYLMSVLPVAFVFVVRTFNPDYFTLMVTTAFGRMLILLAFILWLCGMFTLIKASKVDI